MLWTAPLRTDAQATNVREVPTTAEIVWLGGSGRTLLRVRNATARPVDATIDLVQPADYLLAADGSILRQWRTDHVLTVAEVAGQTLLVSRSGACLDRVCEKQAPGGIELVPGSPAETRVVETAALTARIALDQTRTRYLITINNQYWSGQLALE